MTFPGFTFKTIGGTLKETLVGPTTKRLCIIGTAVDGPINKPTRVRSAADAEKLFGPAKYTGDYLNPSDVASGKPNGATIPLAVHQAIRAGATDIVVVRASGQYATNTTAFDSNFDIRALYPGDIYNSVSITLADGTGSASGTVVFSVSQPNSKGGDFTASFNKTDTIEDVIIGLNNHVRNKTFKMVGTTFPSVLQDAIDDVSAGTEALSGGANETDAPGEAFDGNRALYATRLTTLETGTFDVLYGESFGFDICVLTGMYIDDEAVASDPSKSIARDFVSWLELMSDRVRPCMGVLGCKPTGLTETSDLISYINNSLLATTTGYYDSTTKHLKAGPFLYDGFLRNTVDGQQRDIGGRLMVTAGTDCIWEHPDIGQYVDSFHMWYAGKLCTLPPEKSSQYTPLDGVVGYVNKLPKPYADLLSQGVGFDSTTSLSGRGAYTVLVNSPTTLDGPRVIYDDATASFRNDYFRQYQLQALANSIHVDIYFSLVQFIGLAADESTLAAMKAAVKKVFEGYRESGAISGSQGEGYDFDVKMRPADKILGVVRVDMQFVPASSIRAIVQTLSVTRNAA